MKLIIIPLISCALGLAFSLQAEPQAAPTAPSEDNPELKIMYQEDQSDRKPETGKSIDWNIIGPRDDAREARVKELIATGALKTGPDYYHAAMVLQHASEPNDALLAHDLCILAIERGEKRAKWLAAASMDRFLMRIDRPQRFATQYRSPNFRKPMRLHPVDPSVPDEIRRAFNAPPLAEALAREKKYAEDFEAKKQAEKSKSQ